MESEALRVSLSMKDYYDDWRALARVAVDARWGTVRELEQYVREELGVCGAFAFVCDGHWLPPTEPLRPLLRDGDTLVVTRQQHDMDTGGQDKLQMMKEQALQLLHNVAANGGQHQPKRKRIRRRAKHTITPEPLPTTAPSPHTRLNELLMGNGDTGEQGRLVRALTHNGV